MRTFDGVSKLNKAIERMDALLRGVAIEVPIIKDSQETFKRFTVFKNTSGTERPLAFGMSAGEAKGFVALMKWQITAREIKGINGDPRFDATTYRAGEEDEL